jgi:hypothetical protein
MPRRTMLLLSLFILGPSSIVFAESAEDMLPGCRIVATASTTDQRVAFAGTAAPECWGAFAVIQKVLIITALDAVQPFFGACPPAKSTRTELVAILVEYVKRHPERRHDDFFYVARDAIRAVFPCKQ